MQKFDENLHVLGDEGGVVIIGGNHRCIAYQELVRECGGDEKAVERAFGRHVLRVMVVIYAESCQNPDKTVDHLTNADKARLASEHNRLV